DVRRRLADTILSDHVLVDDASEGGVSSVIIKGHAGSGKSVLLRRIAWDAAHEYDKVCLFLRPDAYLDAAAVCELADLVGERLFLFVDDAVLRSRDLHSVVTQAERTDAKV